MNHRRMVGVRAVKGGTQLARGSYRSNGDDVCNVEAEVERAARSYGRNLLRGTAWSERGWHAGPTLPRSRNKVFENVCKCGDASKRRYRNSSDGEYQFSKFPESTTWKLIRALRLRHLHNNMVRFMIRNIVTTNGCPVCGKAFETTLRARHATKQTPRFASEVAATEPRNRFMRRWELWN